MLKFHASKYESNKVKIEKAVGTKITKQGFEALALKVAKNSVIKGVDKTNADRYAFIGKVDGVYYKLVVLHKAKNNVIRGVSLFALDNQNYESVVRKARNRIVGV